MGQQGYALGAFIEGSSSVIEGRLHEWVAERLDLTASQIQLTQIAGDASPRRYFRVTGVHADEGAPSRVLVEGAPHVDVSPLALGHVTLIAALSPGSENNEAFLAVQQLLLNAGVKVPAQLAHDLNQGFFLMEDMGDTLLSAQLNPASVGEWYEVALSELVKLAVIEPASTGLPAMDGARIAEELAVFPEWFLTGLLGVANADIPRDLIEGLTAHLGEAFATQRQVLVHRDFHCRNLMCLGQGALGVIDFQDAVIGPVTYDAVSLLKDCYVLWDRQDQLRWLEAFRQLLIQSGLDVGPERAFVMGFDMSGLQRHLRVLGVFARLNLRDGKPAYLNDLPLVLHYVCEALSLSRDVPAVNAFAEWFETVVIPRAREQAWFADITPPPALGLAP